MTGGSFLRPQARDDIIAAALYIADDNQDAADRFLDAVKRTMATLEEMPHMGAPREFDHPDLAGMRFFPVTDFDNYLIFYVPRNTAIDVVRVLHGSQDIQTILSEK